MQLTSHLLPRKARGHGGERREEILAHALRLISEAGVHNVSTRQIAQAVGISQPTLYTYFPNRYALIGEVGSRAFAALANRMHRASGAPGTAQERLIAVARNYVTFGLEQPDAYRVAFMIESGTAKEKGADDPVLAAGLATFAIHRQCVADYLADRASADDVALIAQSMWASLHGLVSLLIARPHFPWVDRVQLIDRHIAAMVHGYEPRQNP
ncbi:MAG: TetR/AcrR family transcriptional regulator [Sphingomonas sp.]|nr:TetR/AcrR family transcriptional regulator [Sphingomonas sp.]